MTDNDEVLDSAKRRADEIKARGEAAAENLTPEQKILRDEILNKSSGSVATTPEHHKAIFAAKWGEKTPAEQLELAYAMFCEVGQLRNQVRKRINEGNAEFWEAINSGLETQRQRSHGGRVKAANDPKQAALKDVRREWEEGWRHKKRYKAPFARAMIAKYPVLESTKTIEDKCREWEKETAEKL